MLQFYHCVLRDASGGGGEGGDDSMRELFLHEREVTGQNTHCATSRCGGRPVIQCPDTAALSQHKILLTRTKKK